MRVVNRSTKEWVAFKVRRPPQRGSRTPPIVMNNEKFQHLLRELGHIGATPSPSAEIGVVIGENDTNIRFSYAHRITGGVELNPATTQFPTHDRRIKVILKAYGRPTREDLLSFQNAMLSAFPEMQNTWVRNGVSFAK